MKNTSVTTSPNTKHFQSIYVDREPAEKEGLPTGPFEQGSKGRQGSLLVFVPRNPGSVLIDKMTGGYGYSHLAVDCGEVDIPSGKRVMVEATLRFGVHNAFQDEYGDRKFVRIPLKTTGIDVVEFCNCICSKLGEKFDDEEFITLGLFHDPARQVCSDLATACLQESMHASIARYQRSGFLDSFSAIWTHWRTNKTFHLVVSPNGFAEYFGAPRGGQIDRSDQLAEPVLATRHIRVR